MIPAQLQDLPIANSDRIVAVDRAISGPDQKGKALTAPRFEPFDPNPDPLNRRGRRHITSIMRRQERGAFRSQIRIAATR